MLVGPLELLDECVSSLKLSVLLLVRTLELLSEGIGNFQLSLLLHSTHLIQSVCVSKQRKGKTTSHSTARHDLAGMTGMTACMG